MGQELDKAIRDPKFGKAIRGFRNKENPSEIWIYVQVTGQEVGIAIRDQILGKAIRGDELGKAVRDQD